MPIECQSIPIWCLSDIDPVQSSANRSQSDSNLTPIWHQSDDNPMHQSSDNPVPITRLPIPISSSACSSPNLCQSDVNPVPIDNPSIANSFSCHVMPIHHRSANPMSILYQSIDPLLQQIDTDQLSISSDDSPSSILCPSVANLWPIANAGPIRCQSIPIQYQSGANPSQYDANKV